jgi:L-ascorbate metabolism protein UlaG (beta-lactamase superfamily)
LEKVKNKEVFAVKIKWLGHSCFLITSQSGVRILTDPFDESVGYPLPEVEADIVTVSHGHFDHNYTQAVKGNFSLVDKVGEHSINGVNIKGVFTYHDKNQGKDRGSNIVFNITVDGINICHCGDLGHILTQQHADEIGRVDVLMLPVGGVFTVDTEEAYEVVKVLKPAVTIPMHFKTDALTFSVDGVNKFLALAGGGEMAAKQEIEVTAENLKTLSNVIVLNYK